MFREIWKPIPGYDGVYWVSDLGSVKSLNYNRTGKEEILSPAKNKKGYLQVDLWKDGKRKRLLVHRLVWIAFNGPIQEGYEINHNDESPENNCLDNLSLMTHKENINWGTGIRRRAKTQSKKVEQYTLDGIHIATWFNARGIEKELGYANQNISNCCNGKRKTAYGFVWKFAE